MTELCWYEVYPPRGLSLADVTGLLRVLASRPKLGLQRLTPVVVFELWLRPRRVEWRFGVDAALSSSLPTGLQAQLPALSLVRSDAERPLLTTARDVRGTSLAYPLRLDTAAGVSAGLLNICRSLRSDEVAVVSWVVGPSAGRSRRLVPFSALEALGLTVPPPPDGEDRSAWKTKASEPLFGLRGRIGAAADSSKRAGMLIGQVTGALALAHGTHARLALGPQSSRVAQSLHRVIGRRRSWSVMANAAELAVLLGWPVDGVQPPGTTTSLGPAPQALLVTDDDAGKNKDDVQPDRLLGRSLHPRDSEQLVRLPVASCLTHVQVIGPTNTGKSTVLAQWIVADAAAGRSVLVIEPKGDLVREVLGRLPEARHQDVVVIEPGQTDRVVGFNPLAGPRADAERRADELLGLLRAIFGSAIGPRSSDVLLHALITAARADDGTLTDVPALLTNPGFRRRIIGQVSDPLVLAPFWGWFDGLSEPERRQVTQPVMNKLRVLTTRAPIRRLLGQPHPAFRLDELFTEPRIVLINLNRGVLGPETARLLGSLLLSQLWQAVQRRAAQPESQRRPVMVVLDEWQDYVDALDFGEVLAQARGLGVGLTLAHQHLTQLNPNLRAAVLANARSRLVFRPAQGDAKALAGVLGPDVNPESVERLGAYQAAARVQRDGHISRAFAVATLPLAAPVHDPQKLLAASAARWGVDGAQVDRELLARWQEDEPSEGVIGIVRRTRS